MTRISHCFLILFLIFSATGCGSGEAPAEDSGKQLDLIVKGAHIVTMDAQGTVIEDTASGIDIPPGQQVVLDVTVRLDDTPTNIAGLTFDNTATYTYNRLNNAPATILPGYPGTSDEMTIVEPELTLEKTGPAQLQLGVPVRDGIVGDGNPADDPG